MGTLVNTAAVLLGSTIGLLLRKKISNSASEAIVKVMGVCAFVMGITGLLQTMATVDGTQISFNGSLMLIVCMALGSIIGEKLDIDSHLSKMAKGLENKLHAGEIATGMLNASMIFCIGAMTVIGCFNDGINSDPSVLFLKSALDGVTSVFLSASMGIGVMFSAGTILLLQGSLTLMAVALKAVVTDTMISCICMVGYLIVMLIGTNMSKVTQIKTANLLPSMLFALLWAAFGIQLI